MLKEGDKVFITGMDDWCDCVDCVETYWQDVHNKQATVVMSVINAPTLVFTTSDGIRFSIKDVTYDVCEKCDECKHRFICWTS